MRKTGDVRLALALSALALMACSDPHAGTLPTRSPSPPATTPTSGPTATTSLAAEDEVARAVEHYYSTLQEAAHAPAEDRDTLASLIDSSCKCRQVLSLLADLAQKHHQLIFTVTLGQVRVTRVRATSATAFVDVTQSPGREVDSSGRLIRTLPGSTGHYVLDFTRRDGRWLVTQISRS